MTKEKMENNNNKIKRRNHNTFPLRYERGHISGLANLKWQKRNPSWQMADAFLFGEIMHDIVFIYLF